MTVRELLTYIESVKPHIFPDSALLLWLNELEGRVQLDIFLMAPEETVEYTMPDDNETVLLVDLPHTGIYRYWLEAMIDLESGEYSQYQNDMELFNNAWNEFACWFAETQGTEGDGVSRGFYLSAYGIAVKHGYTGSEEEWLETLKGAPGEDFKYEDFTEEQLAALREGVVQDTLDQARSYAQSAEESARAAEDALEQMGDDAAAAEASAAAAKKSESAAGKSAEEAATYAKAAQDAQTGAEKAKYAVENLEVDAVSVPSGMPAYAQKGVNAEKEVLAIRFGIPKGVSPTVEVTEYEEVENWGDFNIIRSGHDVAITDEEGTKTFRVPAGRNGTDGKDGSVWVPSVNSEGNLSWKKRAGSDFYPEPAPVDIVQMVLDAMPEDSGGETIPGPGGSVDFDTSGLLDKATYDPQGKNTDIFQYVNQKVASVPVQDVAGAIGIHNVDMEAHEDIREIANNALPKTGGTMTGDLHMGLNRLTLGGDADGIYMVSEGGEGDPLLALYGSNGDEPVTVSNVAEPSSEKDAANKQYVDDVKRNLEDQLQTDYFNLLAATIPAPASAEVGQTLVVKAVDANGKPTEWEAVDLPSGGGSNVIIREW